MNLQKVALGLNAIVIVLCILSITVLLPRIKQTHAQEKAEFDSIRVEYVNRIQIQHAYERVMHRIWIDRPAYVEDVLWETEEFLRLDSLLDGNWGYVFEFCGKQDSIDYETNWRYDPVSIGQPDKPAKRAQPDSKLKPVEEMWQCMKIIEYKPSFFTGYEEKSFDVNTKEELLACELCKKWIDDGYTMYLSIDFGGTGSIIAVYNDKKSWWVIGRVYRQSDVDILSQWIPDFHEEIK